MTPEKTVFTSMLVTVTCTTAGSVLPTGMGGKGSLPTPRMLFGTAITYMGLSILADIAPPVAVALSATIAISALTFYGVPIMDKYFSQPPKTK